MVAHRAFHRWKRPAQRSVVASKICAPHKATVKPDTAMRFLRFQAPWAYGKMVFVLLTQHADGMKNTYSLSRHGCG
jgi:hypothetical protein